MSEPDYRMLQEQQEQMQQDTICWRCNEVYELWLDKCPRCRAANANIDYKEKEQCNENDCCGF